MKFEIEKKCIFLKILVSGMKIFLLKTGFVEKYFSRVDQHVILSIL